MTVTVINKVTEYKKKPGRVSDYCGRGSPLGNPFPMADYSDKERTRVCNLYEKWFEEEMEQVEASPAVFMVHKLTLKAAVGNVYLACFCAPKRCHCDTIKKYIDKQLEK